MHHVSPRSLPAAGLLALCAALWLSGCCHCPPAAQAVPAAAVTAGEAPEQMLDWAGTYQAVLPQRAISVQLRDDHTAVVRERRLDTADAQVVYTYEGPFRFDPAGGSLIVLSHSAGEPAAYRFFVGENWIELRDPNTGAALPDPTQLRLRKTSVQ